MSAAEISFERSSADNEIILRIVDRSLELRIHRDRLSAHMDIVACHANGNPLRLSDLLAADDFNFIHDVGGIARHLDRDTGKLTGCFSPRFSAQQSEAA